MTVRRYLGVVLGLLVVMGLLVACESGAKTDVHVRILVREVLLEEQSIRGADNEGQTWTFKINPETVMEDEHGAVALEDLKVSEIVTVKANESASEPGVYDAVIIDVGVLK